jgi:hypothetical protein
MKKKCSDNTIKMLIDKKREIMKETLNHLKELRESLDNTKETALIKTN